MNCQIARYLLVAAAWLAPVSAFGFSGPAGGPIYDAIDLMVNDLTKDLVELAKVTDKAAVTGISTSENLDPDVRTYLRGKIEGANNGDSAFHFVVCKECLAVRAETDGDQILLKKGVDSQEQMQKIASTLRVSSFADTNLTYTGTRLVLQINVFNTKNGELRWSRSYDSRVLSLVKTGLKISVAIGQMVGLGEKGYPTAISLFVAERIYGFGEFGMVGQFNPTQGAFKRDAQIGPMLRVNFNEISGHPWSWGSLLWSFRAAYGWYDSNQRDITLGTGPKLEVGSIYHLSLDYLRGSALSVRDNDKTDQSGETSTASERKPAALPQCLMIGFGFDLG